MALVRVLDVSVRILFSIPVDHKILKRLSATCSDIILQGSLMIWV